MQRLILIANETANKIDGGLTTGSLIDTNDEDLDSDETIVVQLAEKVIDGTKCNNDPDSFDVCIGGNCMVSYIITYNLNLNVTTAVIIKKLNFN